MPRKEQRSGVAYIDNDKDRDLTFYKRRSAPPAVTSADEATTARIGSLQNEVAQLDMENMTEEDKNQLSILRMKNIEEENPGMVAKLIFTKEKGLSLEDLTKLFSDLSRVQKDIKLRLPPLHGREDKTGGTCVAQDLQLPSAADHLGTTHSLMQSPWPHTRGTF
uniref:Uncharacterized protein n=1 Tax=Aegilops tauschii TaxID=37682 RepID=M8CSD0_AEGTA